MKTEKNFSKGKKKITEREKKIAANASRVAAKSHPVAARLKRTSGVGTGAAVATTRAAGATIPVSESEE